MSRNFIGFVRGIFRGNDGSLRRSVSDWRKPTVSGLPLMLVFLLSCQEQAPEVTSFKAALSTSQLTTETAAPSKVNEPIFFLAPGLNDLETIIFAYRRNLNLCSSYDPREAGRFLIYSLEAFEIPYKLIDTRGVTPTPPEETKLSLSQEGDERTGLELAEARPAPSPSTQTAPPPGEEGSSRRFSSPRDPRTQYVADELDRFAKTGDSGMLQALYRGPESSLTGWETFQLLSKAKAGEVKLIAVRTTIEGEEKMVFVPSRIASRLPDYVSSAGEVEAISQALLSELQGQGRAADWDIVPALRYQTVAGGLESPVHQVPTPAEGQSVRQVYGDLLRKEFTPRLESALSAKKFLAVPLGIPGHSMMLIVDKEAGKIELYDPSGVNRYGSTERLGASRLDPWAEAIVDEVKRTAGIDTVINVITEDFQRVESESGYRSDLQCGVHSCSFLERRMKGESYEEVGRIADKPDIVKVRDRFKELVEGKGLTRDALEFYGVTRDADGKLIFETRADVGTFSVDYFFGETSLLGADAEGHSFEARVSAELRDVPIEDFPARVSSLYENYLKKAMVSNAINNWLDFQDKLYKENLFRDFDASPRLAGMSKQEVIYMVLRQEGFKIPPYLAKNLTPDEIKELETALTQLRQDMDPAAFERIDNEIAELQDKYERGIGPDGKELPPVDSPDVKERLKTTKEHLTSIDSQIQTMRETLYPTETRQGPTIVDEPGKLTARPPEASAGPSDEFFRRAQADLTVASVSSDRLPRVSDLPPLRKGLLDRIRQRLERSRSGGGISASEKRRLELDLERTQGIRSAVQNDVKRLEGMARSQTVLSDYQARIDSLTAERQVKLDALDTRLDTIFSKRQTLASQASGRLWARAQGAEAIYRNWDIVREALLAKKPIDVVLREKGISLDTPESRTLVSQFESYRGNVEGIHTAVEGRRVYAEDYQRLALRNRAEEVKSRPEFLDEFRTTTPELRERAPSAEFGERVPAAEGPSGFGRMGAVLGAGAGLLVMVGVGAVIASQAQQLAGDDDDSDTVTCFEFNKRKLWLELEQLATSDHEAYVLGFVLWNKLQTP